MALDSAVKRMAVTGVARPWMRAQHTDVTKPVAWRSSVGNAYPVVSFSPPVIERYTMGMLAAKHVRRRMHRR